MEYLFAPFSLLVGFGLLFLLSKIGGIGDSRDSLPREIVEENPTVVIENVSGVGLSITNGNGKELIIREHGKGKVEIWNVDKRGAVTGKPLIAHREGEAAYLINERMR